LGFWAEFFRIEELRTRFFDREKRGQNVVNCVVIVVILLVVDV
jgi:hypothetical protein